MVDASLIFSYCKRDLSFLVANKSLKDPIYGPFMRAGRSIGIDRPQDLAVKGKGKIMLTHDY
jgi:glycerol-3-phosphate O-acyltransferase/dihydroxyacetone phosphate acyltransferase